jgi:hypothetical protein
MQAEKLRFEEEQEERSGSSGDEKVLPFLQKAHHAPRNQIGSERMEVQLHG